MRSEKLPPGFPEEIEDVHKPVANDHMEVTAWSAVGSSTNQG